MGSDFLDRVSFEQPCKCRCASCIARVRSEHTTLADGTDRHNRPDCWAVAANIARDSLDNTCNCADCVTARAARSWQTAVAEAVPADEVLQAKLTAALDALERLVWAFPELMTQLATAPQQRALRAARALLADAGRGLP